jgi:hypothetical protein
VEDKTCRVRDSGVLELGGADCRKRFWFKGHRRPEDGHHLGAGVDKPNLPGDTGLDSSFTFVLNYLSNAQHNMYSFGSLRLGDLEHLEFCCVICVGFRDLQKFL